MRICTSGPYEHGLARSLPDWIGGSHVKRYRYGQEPYLHETLATVASSGLAPAQLKACAYILVKPDGMPTRCVEKLVQCVEEEGFEVVCIQALRLDRLSIRELWRYELNLSTLDRYRVIDPLLTVGDSMLLAVRDSTSRGDASQRISALKGRADPSKRPANSIRTRIGARGGNLNFIHSPDEFIDFARELGVLLPAAERTKLLAGLGNPALKSDEVKSAIDRTYSAYIRHPLDVSAIDFPDVELAGLGKLERGQFALQCLEAGVPPGSTEFWDLMTIANEYVQVTVPGVTRSLDFELAE